MADKKYAVYSDQVNRKNFLGYLTVSHDGKSAVSHTVYFRGWKMSDESVMLGGVFPVYKDAGPAEIPTRVAWTVGGETRFKTLEQAARYLRLRQLSDDAVGAVPMSPARQFPPAYTVCDADGNDVQGSEFFAIALTLAEAVGPGATVRNMHGEAVASIDTPAPNADPNRCPNCGGSLNQWRHDDVCSGNDGDEVDDDWDGEPIAYTANQFAPGFADAFAPCAPGSYEYNRGEAAGYCHHGYAFGSCDACNAEIGYDIGELLRVVNTALAEGRAPVLTVGEWQALGEDPYRGYSESPRDGAMI